MLLDLLKRPIAAGDTVITKGYGACAMNSVCPVVAVKKDHIIIKLPQRDADARAYNSRTKHPELMKRCGSECIIINEQLAHNKSTWPEHYL